MSSNILLFTAEKISPDDLMQLSQAVNAVNVSDIDEARFNLCRDAQNIWFSLDSYGLSEFEGQPMRLQVEEILQRIPQSCINIEISRASNSERLAAELANYLLQYYEGIVLGVLRQIYTRQDLAKILINEPEPNFDMAISG